MKKNYRLIFFLWAVLILTGCRNETMAFEDVPVNPEKETEASTTVNMEEEPESEVNARDTMVEEPETPESNPVNSPENMVDIDLTLLSKTMVFSEVYNMMASPEDYIGKTVKMKGMFVVYHDDSYDKNYYSCIISDATACCSQGIEFLLTDDYSYPDDYPEETEDICVMGVFDTYLENGLRYCTLKDAKLL